MNVVVRTSLLILVTGVAGCVSGPSAHSDPLCKEVAKFANSSAELAVHTVELLTDWGGVFSDEKDVMFTKSCQREAYGPGVKLCDYLLEHASAEFAGINIRRALICLRSPDAQKYTAAQVEPATGHFTSGRAMYVKAGIVVGVEYSVSPQEAPSLKISAQRIKGH